MYRDAEINMPMNAVAPMTAEFSAVGSGAERECAQQRAARALQAVADGREADDPRFDNDLILVVAVTGQYDSAVAAMVFTHDTDISKRGAAIRDGAREVAYL